MHQVNKVGTLFLPKSLIVFLTFKLGDGARVDKTRKKENRVKDPPNIDSVNCRDLSISIIEHKPVQNKQLRQN